MSLYFCLLSPLITQQGSYKHAWGGEIGGSSKNWAAQAMIHFDMQRFNFMDFMVIDIRFFKKKNKIR